MNWVIDTDAGVDDAIGIAMPFISGRYPDFNLLAFTTVAGNVPVQKVNTNVGALCDLLDLGVPIYDGCDRPMVATYVDAADFHGSDGLGDGGVSRTERKSEAEHAAHALIRLARANKGDFSVLALGPLTNIALACNLDPLFPTYVSKLAIMGGAWRAQGNMSPTSEFNIAVDPESARVTFDRFAAASTETVLVPWEVCFDTQFSFERMRQIASGSGTRAKFFGAMTRKGIEDLQRIWGLNGYPMADPTTFAVVLDPSTITREIRARIVVDIARDVGRAMTALDLRAASKTVRVVTGLDYPRAFDMIEAAWTSS